MRPLDVVAVYSNPIRWRSRADIHSRFEDAMLQTPGVRLTTVECAYGDHPFEFPDRTGINRVRVRARTLLWIKENLINLGIRNLPEDWKYVAWVDADVFFHQQNWALETVHALQLNHIVQPWSDCYDLGPNDEHLASHKSFLRQWRCGAPVCGDKWKSNGGCYDYPHSGYAWAATRQAIDWLGGLLEIAAIGAGDHHMALSFVGKADYSMPGGVGDNYRKHIKMWESRAVQHIRQNLHYVAGTIEHRWHGRKTDRKYLDRWSILLDHGFDPDVDLKRNSYGVFELAGDNIGLASALDRYFRQRNEDANTLE